MSVFQNRDGQSDLEELSLDAHSRSTASTLDSLNRQLFGYMENHSKGVAIAKRTLDIVFATTFFVVFGWLYIVLLLGVILTSGRPAIYSQPRFGKNGKIFKFYKFRSMVSNSAQILEEHLRENPEAQQQWTAFQKLDRDPRITKFGNIIRKTSLDEIPQFWNVLKGDMSIVGPRPCMLGQKDLYGEHWSYYCAVRPGITGLWQVSGRNMLSFQKRVSLDVLYVKELSFYKDCRILFKTLWVVVNRHGSR